MESLKIPACHCFFVCVRGEMLVGYEERRTLVWLLQG